MITLISGLLGVYLLLLLAMVVFQRNLMYLPDKNIGAPESYGLSGFEDLIITSGDNTKIQIWQRKADANMPTVIYFHGNAYHLGSRAAILGALASKGFGVIALSYRGYGKSEGNAFEQGMYHDARAVINHAVHMLKIPVGSILIFGESLGTGVGIQMATEFEVGGLILQSPYLSVAQRAAEIYYFIPVKLLIRDRFDSISKIARVKAPLLVFHGERDSTIPLAHGKAIVEAATGKKQAFYFPEVDHTDFDTDVLARHVLDFAVAHQLAGK